MATKIDVNSQIICKWLLNRKHCDYTAYDQQRDCCKRFDDFNHNHTINDAKIEKWINTLCLRDSTVCIGNHRLYINVGVIRMWLWACVRSEDVLGMCCLMRWCERPLLGWRFQSYLNDRQLNVNYMKNDFLISRPSWNSIQFEKTFGLCVCACERNTFLFLFAQVLINWR